MSSDDIAIRVSNLSKCYQIYDAPRDRLKQFVVPRLQRISRQIPRQYFREFWALKDVTFEIRKGETVGIIGRNGSGKSTLLQVICGTLSPNSGSVETNGRIAALLELGSGFNPEFTGRENVFLNAGILGMTREEIEDRFDSITAFADIGGFIDQPIKTYSSGMHARLGFAVAISVNPNILIVDEILSVGDEAFQRKCFARIHQIKEEGASILFVSHSAGSVIELCNHALLLHQGELILQGKPKFVTSIYQKIIYAPIEKAAEIKHKVLSGTEENLENYVQDTTKSISIEEEEEADFDPNLIPLSTLRYENRGANIEDPHIETPKGKRVNILVHGQEYIYTYGVTFNQSASRVMFGMLIKTTTGLELGGGTTATTLEDSIVYIPSGTSWRIRFQWRCLLTPNTYFMNAGVMGAIGEQHGYLHRLIDAVMFRVKPTTKIHATTLVNFDIKPESVMATTSS